MHVNKFAYPKGGAEVYMLQLAALQAELGHNVAIFGNSPTEWNKPNISFFNFDIRDFHSIPFRDKISTATEVLWSKRAANEFEKALVEFRPDVVHVHNYAHQLSSSIIVSARNHQVPIVATAHDYKLICPAYVANINGKDCFACSKHINIKLLKSRCHHSDLGWSTLVGIEAAIVRAKGLLPDTVIAPSAFMLEALGSSWVAGKTRLTLVRNPATPGGIIWEGGDYLLYVGRLSREKGLHDLIRAAVDSQIPLVIAGDGPLKSELLQLAGNADIKFVGHVDQVELSRLRARCRAQIVPSQWPENAPLSVLEAGIDGVPIIASARGGLPEYKALGAKISLLEVVTGSSLTSALAELAQESPDLDKFASTLGWDRHLENIHVIYEEAAR